MQARVVAPPARIVLVTGRQGSGKSWHLAEIAKPLAPGRVTFVLDVANQWPLGVMRTAPYGLAKSARGAAELLRGRHRLIVVRPDLDATDRPTANVASELARLACAVEGEAVLVLPEAHLAAREGWPLPPGLVSVAHRSRHEKVILLADTQHPARLSTAIRDEARWYVHATVSPRDMRRIKEAVESTVAPDMVDRALAAVRRLDTMGPGWHVVIDGARSDFEPKRT